MASFASKDKRSFSTLTNEETALLIKVVMDYKAAKMQNGEDWGTVMSKYEDILLKFTETFPETATEDFPNSQDKEKITKEKVKRK